VSPKWRSRASRSSPDLRESIRTQSTPGTRTLQEGGLDFWMWSMPMGAAEPETMEFTG
jgi:hypothetical protein